MTSSSHAHLDRQRCGMPWSRARRRKKIWEGRFLVQSVQARGMTSNWFQRRQWKIRQPVDGYLKKNEFPSLCTHCGVMAAFSRTTLTNSIFLRFFAKKTHYGIIFKILSRKDSSPHWSTCCVQISWNLADEKSVESCVDCLTKNFAWPSSSRCCADRAQKSARAIPRQCTRSAPVFIQIGSLSAELYPNAWTSKRVVVFPIFV